MHNLLDRDDGDPRGQEAGCSTTRSCPTRSGLGLVDEIRGYLEALDDRDARRDADRRPVDRTTSPRTVGGKALKLVEEAAGVTEYLLPPLPNTLYTRDTTCWIYGGVTLNPLYWPARHEETILMTAIYKFHPDFAGKVNVWWGDPTEDQGLATLEGGDVMPIGKGIVLDRHERAHLAPGHQPGRGRRCSPRAPPSGSSSRRCRSCAPRCTWTRCSPSPTATACCCTPTSSNKIAHLLVPPEQPSERRRAACDENKPFVDVVAAGAGPQEAARRRDRRQRLPARAHAVGQRHQPGLRLARRGLRLRPQHLHQHAAAQGGHRGHHHRRRRARPRPWRRPLHDLPDHPRRGRLLIERRAWPGPPAASFCPGASSAWFGSPTPPAIIMIMSIGRRSVMGTVPPERTR